MSGKIAHQFVRCTDTRLNAVCYLLLESLGVPRDRYGHLYDATIIAGGAGLIADEQFLVSKMLALYRAHETDVAIITAHSDCAAGGNYGEFVQNVAAIRAAFDAEDSQCELLSFFMEKTESGWRVSSPDTREYVAGVAMKFGRAHSNALNWIRFGKES